MATIDEIARRAKVSKTTVSFVINGRPGPSAETIAHVRRIMAEMDYVPSMLAQRFASQRSMTIALVVLPYPHVFSDIHHGEALDAVYETLGNAKYSLLLTTSNPRFVDERRYSTMLRSGHVDGMLLLEPTLDQGYLGELAAENAPVVIINSDGAAIGLDFVRTDDAAVGQMAAEHLLGLGHRSFGFVAASSNHASARDRSKGFLRALEAAGVPICGGRIFSGAYDTSYWSGHQGCTQILRDFPDTTALFCCNDTMALGALEAAREAGRRVPEELSIIGVDDNPTSSYSNPPLTTIRQASYDVAKEATQALLERLQAQGDGARQTVARALAPTLVERESTAPPRPPET
jgi:DNA-binding LacI/PurR family transcriptional regulator